MASAAQLLARLVLTATQRDHVADLRLDDAGHGWDRFGASVAGAQVGLCVARHLYDYYFRVQSHGAHHIPATGPTIVVSNHSGMLPLDGIMLWADILQRTHPPRLPRPIADYFVPRVPFINILFSRAGLVAGSRDNASLLLERGELLEVFPEGVAGIGKNYRDRYQLQRWTHGHVELAIRHGARVLPVAVIGAEEQWPQVAKIEGLKMFGVPYLPVPATPLPMPVQYHLHYGEPIAFGDEYRPEDADDAAVLAQAAGRTRRAVEALISEGLANRRGVFR